MGALHGGDLGASHGPSLLFLFLIHSTTSTQLHINTHCNPPDSPTYSKHLTPQPPPSQHGSPSETKGRSVQQV